ncbi:MAG: hypothetical protein ABIK43_00190 [candidate division WOR-3 bacterium]
MSDRQSYTVMLRDGDRELKSALLHATRSMTAVFAEMPEVVPSTERSTYFELEGGYHTVTLVLGGTIASSGAIAVEVLPAEKYE